MVAPGTLRARLAGLKPPSAATFSVVEISSSPAAYAAIDGHGRPAVLVETLSTTSREMVRRGLRLQHRAKCHVEIGGIFRTVTASLVACETDDPALQEAFVSIGDILLARLSVATEAEVVAILEELVELLERPGEPSREGAIGLFAELLVLSLARDPVAAVHAWRIGAGDRYDFVLGTGRIEVKASGTRERRHRFSLEQCLPDAGTKAFVASTLVLEGSGGTGVRDLAARVQAMVQKEVDLTMKIQRAILSVMGLPRSGEPIFDEAHAVTKLRWYDVRDMPAVRAVPEGVDQVRFRVNLEGMKPLTLQDLEVRGEQISPCLPPLEN
ncbi:PD-(D/E)XK motif protein [Pseudoroseicyclus sp. CLL3-39]|uniref:PD-(D/E)XK motif protein n=2 Tax=Pseudoroseicyclus tamaricis TaxID=2705421 RepID=A0A6B2JMR9_9RHOB|nr:PD-(D/E)XK motif protein [Pseudoroseicyclus tamaricis]